MGGREPNEGIFFSFDGLYWNITAPKVALIGNPNIPIRDAYTGIHPTGPTDTSASNYMPQTIGEEMDTSNMNNPWAGGNRFEIGRVTDNRGWLLSFTQLMDQIQGAQGNNVDVIFDDQPFGSQPSYRLWGVVGNDGTVDIVKAIPIKFDSLDVVNKTRFWNIEWNYLIRTGEIGNLGNFEFFGGPRYFELKDDFNVTTATGGSGALDGSWWNTTAQNNVIGGQLGVRWFKTRGRWTFNGEGRFFAGLNCQNIYQNGEFMVSPNATFTPLNWTGGDIAHSAFIREFTPCIEVRLEMRYALTRSINLHAGYTGMWMDHIARASSMINYDVTDNLGILTDQNNQNIWTNGVTVGIDINR